MGVRVCAVLALFLAMLCARPAHASTIVQTVSGNQRTPHSIDLFDPSLGTLQVVQIEGVMGLNMDVVRGDVSNFSDLSISQAASGDLSILNGGFSFATVQLSGTEHYPAGSIFGSITLSGDVFEVLTGSDVDSFIAGKYTTSPIWPVSTIPTPLGGTRMPGPGDLFTYSLAFTYIYAPAIGVPEPSTWAMLLLGFAALGVRLRRKSARNCPSRRSASLPNFSHRTAANPNTRRLAN
jgi:hypothetical protein